jgi:hypothetical protein
MKTITLKKIFTTIIFITIISFANSQTTVSGGIFANTTWTAANSPYTADTVVVFPGVTLTIEPGVTVIINGNLEIREAKLIAEGTATDSITFIGSAADSLSNIAVYFHDAHSSRLNYCVIKDSPDRGLVARMFSSSDSLTIKNSYFTNNGTGAYGLMGIVMIDSCLFRNNLTATDQTYFSITNSIFRKNYYGLRIVQGSNIQNCIIDSNTVSGIECWANNNIANCEIKNNGIGIKCTSGGSYNSLIHNNIIENDSIGIQLSNGFGPDSIYCNKICNNTTYNVKTTQPFNRSVAYNYWCTNDSLAIAGSIYDGYDNASLGLVRFMPIDTSQCYLVNGIPLYDNYPISFNIFPNPAIDYLTVELPANISETEIKIFNIFGGIEYHAIAEKQKTNVDVSALAQGIYIIQVTTDGKISRQKFIRQ